MEWISVKDRLPNLNNRIFVPVLVYRKENPYPTTRMYVALGFRSSATVTHWMPLPKKPEITDED